MISWKDGLLKKRSVDLRQIPTKKPMWTTSYWITKDGNVFKRHYNYVSKTSEWGDMVSPILNDAGAQGYITDHWLPVETCIALAWLKRAPDGATKVKVNDGKLHVDDIEWVTAEVSEDEFDDVGEKWSTLKWKCGACTCDPSYKISNRGRLKNGKGDITRGFWFNGRRWAAVKGAGLVPLTTAAKLDPNTFYLTPAIKQAYECLLNDETPDQLARYAGIGINTAWSYAWHACQHVTKKEAKRIASIVISDDLWRILTRLYNDQDKRLGQSLTELMGAVEKEDSDISSTDYSMNELKVGRLLIKKVYG